jgi:hypothetical protein
MYLYLKSALSVWQGLYWGPWALSLDASILEKIVGIFMFIISDVHAKGIRELGNCHSPDAKHFRRVIFWCKAGD